MSPSWSGKTMPESLSLVCQHLVGLTWFQGETHASGEYSSKPQWQCASAFIVDIAGKAWLVTAAHVFTKVEKLRRKNPLFKTSMHRIWDIWSPKATVKQPILMDFFDQDVFRIPIDKVDQGIDLALMPLTKYWGQFFSKTISIFRRADWIDSDAHDYDNYYIVGTPSCFAEEEVAASENGGRLTVFHRPFLVAVERIDESEVCERENSQFVAHIHDAYPIPNIEGMSGGPILGFRRDSNGVFRYWPVAIQSRWIKERRIVIGTLLAPCLREFESVLLERLAAASQS